MTNTSRHLATVIEVFATQATTGAACNVPEATGGTSRPLPCVTAHSLNLQQLPHHMHVVGRVPCLHPERAQRAFLIRSGGTDWAVLTGTHSVLYVSRGPLRAICLSPSM